MNVLPTQRELDQLENTLEKESISEKETMRGLKKPKSTTTRSKAESRGGDEEKETTKSYFSWATTRTTTKIST